ncbi:MAG: enoyl-CoA hydratase/isomerase family protein, partial [Planctomycetes bacterium]|nr:enoyl-CoA hydratase/isomerase family protein [Planctomycetota bacterium]
MSYATIETRPDGVAVVWMDQEGEKVNTLSEEMLSEFEGLMERLRSDSAIRALVLASRKDDFIAGANVEKILDIDEPGKAAELSRRGHALLDRMETGTKPVVAAIHGACLGGGLEVALACRGRIASDHPRTVLGLPEVQLGLLPGGGGTQRLPRLVGLSKSLDMMLTGKRIFARPALKMGLVDALIYPGGLVDAAARLALDLAEGKPAGKRRRRGFLQWFLDSTGPGRKLVFSQAAKAVHALTRGNYPAPAKIMEAVRKGLEEGSAAGYEAETLGFDELVRTQAAKSLIRLFLGMTARKKNPLADHVRPVKRLGVLGAGLMGAGIANVSAQKEIVVALKDVDWKRVAGGVKHVWQDLDGRRKKGALARTERDRIAARIAGAIDLEKFRRVDLVIEAVFEDLDLKKRVIAETQAVMRPESIFATNTSALPIGQIAQASARPETVVGMHYFSPVEKMPLLEIIRTEKTADWVVATAYDVGVKQGKTPIVVGDGPGFYTSRILGPYMNEAMLLLEEGADFLALDRALKDFGFPVGPIALLDEVGIDVAAHVSRNMASFVAARGARASGAAQRLADAGLFGRKNGRGFFLYPPKGGWKRLFFRKKRPNRRVYKVIGAASRREFPPQEMAERLALGMANEAAR